MPPPPNLYPITSYRSLFNFINFPILLPSDISRQNPPSIPVMGCGAAKATSSLAFVCFVVNNPCVLSASRADLAFLFHKFANFTPPPPPPFYFHYFRNRMTKGYSKGSGLFTCATGWGRGEYNWNI